MVYTIVSWVIKYSTSYATSRYILIITLFIIVGINCIRAKIICGNYIEKYSWNALLTNIQLILLHPNHSNCLDWKTNYIISRDKNW